MTFKRFRAAFRRVTRLSRTNDEAGAIARIAANVDFAGGNFWALVLAIVVASVGLNVNSTAVIIGAMLISPLMGPIMGIGLGLGINDLGLVRRAIRNLAIAAAASILTSALYFSLSPLAEAQSELLARTRPTIYDVLIALSGGLAGVMATTRRGDTGNVIPGVAIATALMPPLCTAGYGLAQGDWRFFVGALYLFLINAVFIGLATLVGVRVLGFTRVVDLNPAHARRIRLVIATLIALTVVPSALVATQVVRETRRESAARRFIREHMTWANRAVTNVAISPSDNTTIDVTILGSPLTTAEQAELRRLLPESGLGGARLRIHESLDVATLNEVRSGMLADVDRRQQQVLASLNTRLLSLEKDTARAASGTQRELAMELDALSDQFRALGLGPVFRPGATGADSVRSGATLTWRRLPSAAEQRGIEAFLRRRLSDSSLTISHVVER